MMQSSTTKRSSVVQKLLERTPNYEPEVQEAMGSYQEARAKSRDTTMLGLRFRDGTVENFAYSYLSRVRFEPGDRIVLRFGVDEVQITGRNLERISETISEHRARYVQQGQEGDEMLKSEHEPHIDDIIITELEEV